MIDLVFYESKKFVVDVKIVRTINRYLKQLVEQGLIIKRRKGSTPNIYTLL